jgi:hypothetical protein
MSQHLEGITRGCVDMSVMSKSSAKERLHRNASDLNTITVTTASGSGHIFCAATSLQCGQAWLYLQSCVLLMIGVFGNPKHVE